MLRHRALPLRSLLAIAALLVWVEPGQADDTAQARAAHERGARAIRQGDADGAVEQLETAARLAPEDADIQALYGQALLAAGESKRALEALERALALAPQQPGIAYYAGLASFRLGDWPRATRYLEQAAAEQPDSGITALYLGIALSEMDRADAARASFERAAQVDPTLSGQAAYRIGLIELAARRFDEAVVQFERVEQAQPGSALARSARAYIDQIESGGLRRWNLNAQVGGGYDTNVSLGTDEVAGLGIKSGVGQAAVGGSAILLDGLRGDLLAGQHVYISFHGGSPANDFDQIVTSTWLTGSYDVNDRLSGQLGYTFQYVWAGYEGFRATQVVEPSLRLGTGKRLRSDLFYRMEARDYAIDPTGALAALDRDGFVHRLGLDQYWITPDWTGWGAGFAKVGFRLRRESTDGTENDASGIEPVATLGIALPRELFLTIDASYEWRDFDSPSITNPTGSERFDWITQVGATLHAPLYGKMYGDVLYRFTNRSSNVAFYRYDRHQIDFVLTYPY